MLIILISSIEVADKDKKMNRAASIELDDNEELFNQLKARPALAWPTVGLFVAAYSLFIAATYAYFNGILSLTAAIILNSIASYISFAVVHEASHRAVSTNHKLNDWIGRLGILLLEPAPLLSVFRIVHMQHHRFTNDPEKDPDVSLSLGSKWLLPFKWMVFDIVYFKYYLNPEVFKARPKAERREFYFAIAFAIAVVSFFVIAGWIQYYLLLFFIPSRIAKFFIIWVFDYLPHFPHKTYATENKYVSTSNRVGLEWLLTPLLVYQNYHLVHHLYPTVPFYRYIKIWNAKKKFHDAQNPAVTKP